MIGFYCSKQTLNLFSIKSRSPKSPSPEISSSNSQSLSAVHPFSKCASLSHLQTPLTTSSHSSPRSISDLALSISSFFTLNQTPPDAPTRRAVLTISHLNFCNLFLHLCRTGNTHASISVTSFISNSSSNWHATFHAIAFL